MKAWIGKSIVAIGILHSIVGFVVFYDILSLLISERLFNTVTLNRQPDREAAFWFLFTGFAILIIGALVDWIERKNVGIPAFLSWSFLAVTAMGALIMPMSGFWLLLIPTAGLFRWQRRSMNGE
ncbi:MAG: hypothetical protein JRI58_13785 [Deltaproteobacteria bacterium]|nr:hypothetical protein [Deltaproteobacteria bacterium]